MFDLDLSQVSKVIQASSEGAAFVFLLLSFQLLRSTLKSPPRNDPTGKKFETSLRSVRWYMAFTLIFLVVSFFFHYLLTQQKQHASLILRPLQSDLRHEVHLPRVQADNVPVAFDSDGNASLQIGGKVNLLIEANRMSQDFEQILDIRGQSESRTQDELAKCLDESAIER